MAAEKEENSQKLANSQSPPGAVFVARHLKNPHLHCTWCNKKGHEHDKCWTKNPKLKPKGKGKGFQIRGQATKQEHVISYAGKLDSYFTPPEDHHTILMAGNSATKGHQLRQPWVLDTGATNHITGNPAHLVKDSLRPYTGPGYVGVDGRLRHPPHLATARIPCETTAGILLWLDIRNTIYDPNARCNILSFSQLLHSGSIRIGLVGNTFRITTPKGEVPVDAQDGLFQPRLWGGNWSATS